MIRAVLVVNLELAFRRLEPFDGFAFQNHGKHPFGFGVELLHGVKAVRKAPKQVFRHVALIGG